jgi:hypothetical protein
MSRSRRMRINERSIVSGPTASTANAHRSPETGTAAGSYRRFAYAGISGQSAASGWKASFMSV